MVRNKTNMQEKLAKELPGKDNVFVVEGDLADYQSLAVSTRPLHMSCCQGQGLTLSLRSDLSRRLPRQLPRFWEGSWTT